MMSIQRLYSSLFPTPSLAPCVTCQVPNASSVH